MPFAESIGALNHLLDDGVILMAGLSNVDVDQIEQAMELTDGRIVSVQNQFSPSFRSSLPELQRCAELGPRVPSLQPPGRHRERRPPRRQQRGLPADRGRPRRQPAAGRTGVGAVTGAGRDPDPGRLATETIRDSAAAADLCTSRRRSWRALRLPAPTRVARYPAVARYACGPRDAAADRASRSEALQDRRRPLRSGVAGGLRDRGQRSVFDRVTGSCRTAADPSGRPESRSRRCSPCRSS